MSSLSLSFSPSYAEPASSEVGRGVAGQPQNQRHGKACSVAHGLICVIQDPVAECQQRCQRELEKMKREQEEKVQEAKKKNKEQRKRILEAQMKEHEEEMQMLLETKERELKEKQTLLNEEQDKENEEAMEVIIQENKLQEAKLRANHKKEERAARKAAEKKQEGGAVAATAVLSHTFPECPVKTNEKYFFFKPTNQENVIG